MNTRPDTDPEEHPPPFRKALPIVMNVFYIFKEAKLFFKIALLYFVDLMEFLTI